MTASFRFAMLAGVIVLTALITVPARGAGSDQRISRYDGAPAEGFVDFMARKFARGVVNALTGLGELPRQITQTTLTEDAVTGATLGLFKGVMMSVVRTGVGAVEAVTFFIPAPGYYDPILDPEFVWQSRVQYTVQQD